MNKTVNINLAGIFFHIDEDAYLKLQRYLEAIKRSFTDSQGRTEIIADIEARISELFSERVRDARQVIGTKEVDEVITIMGQPEDYIVDDEIFEDEPKTKSQFAPKEGKKLYRDTDNSYVGGVCAGIGHYFNIDVVWVRLIWFLLIFGAGTGVFLYILLWIFIPEATSTSEKLMMTGEKVTISNIEKKIRHGFESATENVSTSLQKAGTKLKEGLEGASESVSESIKKIESGKQGNRIKSGSKSFFDALTDFIMFFVKIFGKFIGLILAFVSIITIISLVASLIGLNFVDNFHFFDWHIEDFSDFSDIKSWPISIFGFLVVAIPLFALFYLGLKILVGNLKSLGSAARFSLFGLWIIAVIGLGILILKQGNNFSEKSSVISTTQLDNIVKNDTLVITMRSNDFYAERYIRDYGFETGYNQDGDRIKYSQGVRLVVKSTRDSVAKIRINKSARGNTFSNAKGLAESIDYYYSFKNNVLALDNNFLIPLNEKYRKHEVEVTVFLPEGAIIYADENTYNYHRNNTRTYNDILNNGKEEQYLQVKRNKLECLDCDDNKNKSSSKIEEEDDTSKLVVNDEGLEVKTDNLDLKIDDNGVNGSTKNINVDINEDDGIKITQKKDEKN